MTDVAAIADELVARFGRVVRNDGSKVKLVEAKDNLIVIGYSPAAAAECQDGACVMPEAELRTLMLEALATRAPDVELRVVRLAN